MQILPLIRMTVVPISSVIGMTVVRIASVFQKMKKDFQTMAYKFYGFTTTPMHWFEMLGLPLRHKFQIFMMKLVVVMSISALVLSEFSVKNADVFTLNFTPKPRIIYIKSLRERRCNIHVNHTCPCYVCLNMWKKLSAVENELPNSSFGLITQNGGKLHEELIQSECRFPDRIVTETVFQLSTLT